jgi:hypothetical protein
LNLNFLVVFVVMTDLLLIKGRRVLDVAIVKGLHESLSALNLTHNCFFFYRGLLHRLVENLLLRLEVFL